MRVQVFQLFYKSDNAGGLLPVDNILYTLARNYAEENIAVPLDLQTFKNVWVACETDDEDKPVRCLGILCMTLRADFPICRFTDNGAVVKLVQRANDYLHDTFNARGQEATIHIKADEPVEGHCPNRNDWMKAYDLRPADRWLIKVR